MYPLLSSNDNDTHQLVLEVGEDLRNVGESVGRGHFQTGKLAEHCVVQIQPLVNLENKLKSVTLYLLETTKRRF